MEKVNIIITGVSYFSSGVSVMRVRNLFTPLLSNSKITVKNIIVSSKGKDNLLENYSNYKNIAYKIISYNLFNLFSVFNFILKSFLAIKQFKEKDSHNLLYLYEPDLEMIFVLLFAKIFRYRILFDIVEDNSMIKDYSSLKSRIKTYFSLFLINKISLFADGAIAISSHIEQKLKTVSKKQFPVQLIPISVDFNNFLSIKKSNEDGVRLFYGGSFGEKDSIELLLQAFETISLSDKNIKIIMTGKGAKRHEDKLFKFIENNSAKDRIIFKGFLPLNEYYSILNDCDIMCVIRSNSAFANGGFPFKLGEYLASGKAVIASDVSDIKYYLKDKINSMLIRPDSKDDLVKAIKTLIDNKDLRLRIGEEGRKTAKEFFDNIVVTETFFSFIKNEII